MAVNSDQQDSGGGTVGPGSWPTISVVIPTLNAAALIGNCLESVARQTYPRERVEIILADALSTDETRKIAVRYGAVVIDDRGRNMEEGKRLALQHAHGEYVVFLDADNELTHPDFFALAVRGLERNPRALGLESYYLPSAKMSSFCAYLTHRLHISDPICWLMSREPVFVGAEAEVERWTLPGDALSYPLGANGFVFRRADLESVRAGEHFQDTHVAMHLMRTGRREWLRLRGRGVHHYYVQSLWRFLQKRRRATVHFLRVQEEVPVNWMREKPAVPSWLAAVYCVSVVGPVYHVVRGLWRDRDPRWGWHLPASFLSLGGVLWGMLTFRRHRDEKNLVARLQPEQTLKTQSQTTKTKP